MSVWTSLYTGASGLTAHSQAINVVGDNIANVSTVGYKSGNANFNDVLGQRNLRGQAMGAGVEMGGVNQSFGQGSFMSTGGSLDYSIQGDGFFMLSGALDGVQGDYYTRDGRFSLDNEGFVVNQHGLRVQGYDLDANGAVQGAPADIALGQTIPPVPTSSLGLELNLESNDETPGVAFNPADPEGTADWSTSVDVYDSLGNAHAVQLFFTNNGGGAWEWHAMVDGGELTGGTAGTLTEIADGNLGFTSDGYLDTETINTNTASFLGASGPQTLDFDFGDAITTDGGTGMEGTTQYGSPTTINQITQDGSAPGELLDVITAEDGTISGVYSNGQTEPLAKVATAMFQAPDGLFRANDQLWTATQDSGQALVGEPGTGGRGAIAQGALEGSNVDLGKELVTLIAYQRAFQANSRTITTADEMLTEINNLKR